MLPSQHVSRISNMSTYLYPDTSCLSGIPGVNAALGINDAVHTYIYIERLIFQNAGSLSVLTMNKRNWSKDSS